MQSLLGLVINICLFSAKPQDLPAARGLLIASALATFFSYHASNTMLANAGIPSTMLLALTQTMLLGGGLWLVLVIYKKSQRWLKSATALYAAATTTHLAALPMIIWMRSGEQLSAPMWGLVAFRIWFFAISIYIFKETLEIPLRLALVISVVLQLLFAVVLVGLFANSSAP